MAHPAGVRTITGGPRGHARLSWDRLEEEIALDSPIPMKKLADLLDGRAPSTMLGTNTALDAARRMKEEHIGAVLIADEAGAPLGVFSERDLTNRVVSRGLDPDATLLTDVMTRGLFTASPDDGIHATLIEMQDRHIRHLPILEDGELVAVLSIRDLLRSLLAATRGQVNDLTRYIRGA